MAKIPVANIHVEAATNQHLVPQCYMREWTYNSNQTSVWLYQKEDGIAETDINQIEVLCGSKKIEKINAIDNYYDLKAGCYFLPQEALDEIFGPTMHLKVSFEGESLDTEKKRNDKYGVFDEWVVTDEVGVELTEKEYAALKKYFIDARFVFIEKEWDRQYETHWRNYIKDFQTKIINTKNGSTTKEINGKSVSTSITSDTIAEIIKMLIIFDIRGFSSDEYINEQIDSIFDILPPELADMPLDEDDRMHPMEISVREMFRHQYILRLCYDILSDNQMTGIAKTIWDRYKKKLAPRFCLTDLGHPFVTSERPAFIHKLDSGEKVQIFVALPTMLIELGRGDKGQFFINNLTQDEVDEYNKIIASNNDYIISNNNQLDVKKLWSK